MYWKRRILKEKKHLKEIGTKEEFVKKKIKSLLGCDAQVEEEIIRKDGSDVSEYLKKISEEILMLPILRAPLGGKEDDVQHAGISISGTITTRQIVQYAIKTAQPVWQVPTIKASAEEVSRGPMLVQNANIFTQNGVKIWQGKLVLGEKTISLLKYISNITARPLYVLKESDEIMLKNIAGTIDRDFFVKQRAVLKIDGEKAELVYRGVTGDILIPL